MHFPLYNVADYLNSQTATFQAACVTISCPEGMKELWINKTHLLNPTHRVNPHLGGKVNRMTN